MKKENIFILIFLVISIAVYFLTTTFIFLFETPQRQGFYKELDMDNTYDPNIVLDSNDNIYVTGRSLSNYVNGIEIKKYNSNGNLLWNTTWGDRLDDAGTAVIVNENGDLFLTGSTQKWSASFDVILAKYNQLGYLEWNITWGDAENEICYDLSYDSNGNIYAAGSSTNITSGRNDFLLIKFNQNGIPQWNRTWGGLYEDVINAIVIDKNDDIYLSGKTYRYNTNFTDIILLKYNSSGSQIWNRTCDRFLSNTSSFDVAIDSNNFIYVSAFGLGNEMQAEVSLYKYNDRGDRQWGLIWWTTLEYSGRAIAIDSDDYLYIIGEEEYQDADLVIYKYSSTPDFIDKYSLNREDIDGIKIAIDSNNNILVVGETTKDLFLVRFPSEGDIYSFGMISAFYFLIILSVIISVIDYGILKDRKNLINTSFDAPQFGPEKGANMKKDSFYLDKYLEGKFDPFSPDIHLVQDQDLLFKSDLIMDDRTEIFRLVLFQFSFLACSFYIVLVSLAIRLNLGLEFDPSEDFMLSMDILTNFFIVAMLLLMVFVETIILIETKKRFYIIITKNHLIKIPHYSAKYEKRESVPLSAINWICFKSSFFRKKQGCGDIEIVSTENKIHISNVPKIKKFQNIIESALYYYGGIKEIWDTIRLKEEYAFPIKYSKSPNQTKDIKRAMTKYILYFIGIQIGVIIILVLMNITSVSSLIFSIFLPILFIFSSLFSAYPLYRYFYLYKWFHMKSKTLVILENKIISKTDKSSKEIVFQKEFALCSEFSHPIRIKSEKEKFRYLKSVRIKPLIDSKEDLTFGLVDNFSDLVKTIFGYSIVSKYQRGILRPLDEISNHYSADISTKK